MNKIVLAGFSAALLVAATGTARADLIANGGFETPGTTPGTYSQYGGGGNIGGWTVTGNDVLVINNSYSEDTLGFNAHGGQNALDITGASNTGPSDGVFQNIATTAGQTYSLSFWVGNADTTGSFAPYYTQPSTINLQIDGGSLVAFTNRNVTENAINWEEFTYLFTATGSSTNLAFLNGTTGDNEAGLDDVSLVAVPEPASLALLGAGLLAFGSLRRRKPRAA
jgi:hypothetical protein